MKLSGCTVLPVGLLPVGLLPARSKIGPVWMHRSCLNADWKIIREKSTSRPVTKRTAARGTYQVGQRAKAASSVGAFSSAASAFCCRPRRPMRLKNCFDMDDCGTKGARGGGGGEGTGAG